MTLTWIGAFRKEPQPSLKAEDVYAERIAGLAVDALKGSVQTLAEKNKAHRQSRRSAGEVSCETAGHGLPATLADASTFPNHMRCMIDGRLVCLEQRIRLRRF